MAHMSPKLRLELANDIWLTLKTLGNKKIYFLFIQRGYNCIKIIFLEY